MNESYVWLDPGENGKFKRGRYDSFVYGDEKEIAKWIKKSETHTAALQSLHALYKAWVDDNHPVQIHLKILRKDNKPLLDPLPVPPALQEWRDGVFNRTRKAPKRKRGPDGFQNVLRDRSIVKVVKALVVYQGIPATSVKAVFPGDERPSACHVVADTMGMKYKTVRKVWQNRKWDKFKEAFGLYIETGDRKHYNRAMSMNLFIKNDRRRRVRARTKTTVKKRADRAVD